MENTKHWVSFWGNATSITGNSVARYAKDVTLRYPIYVPFSGSAVRLTFDNFCGIEEVVISKVTILYKNEIYPVLYNKQQEIRISAGEKVVTDALNMNLEADATIWVSIYLGEFTPIRAGVVTVGPLSNGVYANGDQTECKELDINISSETNTFYYLTNVSMLTEKENRAIVCFGDSITAQAWPDYLKIRCKNEGYGKTAIVRRAVSGSRILRQYDCVDYECYGWSGQRRYPHDVPTDGADTVIILHGINDIIHPVGVEVNKFRPISDLPTAEEMFEGVKQYIKIARELGYKVYVGTLLPMEGWRTDAPFRQEIRNAFNDMIRNSDLIDGVIDFDMAMKQKEHPNRMIMEYDAGDHLHPGAAGHERMAMEIPKELLK